MKLEILRRDAVGPRRGTVALIHGAWHGAWCWEDNFLPYFADRGYDVLAPSLRGHGASGGYERIRSWRIRDYAADVERAIAGVEGPIYLVGHSMGGFVAQHLLAKRRFAGAVLLDAVPPGGVVPLAAKLFRHYPLTLLRANLTMSLYPLVADRARARRMFFADDVPADRVAAAHAKLGEESFFAFIDMLGLDLPKPPLAGTPVLVAGGEHDWLFPKRGLCAIAARYGADCTVFAGRGHNPMQEPGWQAAADRVLDFFAAGASQAA